MEHKQRRLRSRFRDWRHRRSRSHTPAASQDESASNPPTFTEAVPQTAAVDQGVSTVMEPATGHTALSPRTNESQTDQRVRASSAELQGMGNSPEAAPVIILSKPDKDESPVFGSIDEESSALWKQAYDELRKDNPVLVEEYEVVLKEQSGVPHDGDMQEQMQKIAKTQQSKCKNKQWVIQWPGHRVSVRDTVERIVSVLSRSASLISIGMNYAPPYVSVPWSAATALIPLMMNHFNEHNKCIDGLEDVVKLTFSYQMAEQTFLGSPDTRGRYCESVMGLYKKILEYEALAMQYFGRSTLRRLGRDVAGSTEWADMPKKISEMDRHAWKSLDFLGQLKLSEMLEHQKNAIIDCIQGAAAEKNKVTKVARWVSAISFELDHHDVRSKLGSDHNCSGGWFLDDPRVRAWRNWDWTNPDSSQCLWLRGGVGTGKSSLVSIMVQDLIDSAGGCVAFFYCSNKAGKDKSNEGSTARNDHTNVLRCLLSQASVSVDGSAVNQEVQSRYDRANGPHGVLDGVVLTEEDCVQMLHEIFSVGHDQKFTVVVDALDECLDYDALMDALRRATSRNKNVRLFFSSRLQIQLYNYFKGSICVDVGENNVEDIKSFLDIETRRRRDGSGMTDKQTRRLINTLTAKASGMFMWVRLQLNLFLNEIRSKRIRFEKDIEQKLVSLESSEAIGEELLYAAYQQVYEAAIGFEEDRRKEIVTTALSWVLCAFRTLTLRELTYATSVRPNGTVADDIQEGLVMELCSNLLIEDAIGNIRLTHLSVRHYLEAKKGPGFPGFDAQHEHLQAALACLYFANSPKYHEIVDNSADTIQHGNVALTKSFQMYVQANWTRHCREADKSTELNELMDKLARRSTSLRKASTLGGSKASSDLYADFTAEDIVEGRASKRDVSRSFVDLLQRHNDDAVNVVEQFVARCGDLGVRNQLGNTLLHEAVRFRVTEVMSLLLNAGAPVNARDGVGNTPLHLTALYRFDHGAQILLQARADKNACNSQGETPLHMAISLAVHDVIDTLLSANVDGLARDHFDDTPLHRAAALGNSTVTQSLLAMGFSPDGKNQSGSTPLSLAIKLHHPKVAKVLLENGASTTSDDLARLGVDEEKMLQRRRGDSNVCPGPDLKEKRSTYTVQFPNGSQACDRCDISRWLTGSIRGTSYRHHSSIQKLFASAADGCPLCKVFCEQLSQVEDKWRSGYASEQLTVSLDPSHTQGSRQDRADRLLLSAGSTQLLKLELCLSKSCERVIRPRSPTKYDQHDRLMPELGWLCGRQVEEQPLEFSSLSTVMGWIKTCQNEHHVCRRDGPSGLLPHRLLDVGIEEDSTVRLFDTQTCFSDVGDMQFVYLSYHWGKPPAVMATCHNLQSLMAGIPLASMAEVHQDAITTTRRLGFRYLWVDALCVIQDSREDWDLEASRMEYYISNAAFILQAAASPESDCGLYHPRPQPLLHVRITRTGESQDIGSYHKANISTSVALRLPLQTASEALGVRAMTRGWMFQEMILPRRILIFGADQMYWHCQEGLMSEGDTLIHEPMLKLLPVSSALTHFERRDSFHSWYDLLSKFSASRHAVKSHRLASMAPLARYFDADATLVSGLWKEDLRNGLLWRVDDIRTASIDEFFMSWSWISIDDRVQYDLLGGARHDLTPAGQFSITDVSMDHGDQYSRKELPDNFEGPVNHIEIEAMVCEAHITRFEEGCICFFDKIEWDIDWRDAKKFLFVLVCPWTPNPASELKQACGLGLIVRRSDLHRSNVRRSEDREKRLFERCGLFLGTAYDTRLERWTRQRLRLR